MRAYPMTQYEREVQAAERGAVERRQDFDQSSRGGANTWANVVAACGPCNTRKGSTVGLMHPMKVPREPTPAELHALARDHFRRQVHATWVDYLPAAAA